MSSQIVDNALWLTKDEMQALSSQRIMHTQSVIDVGCGIRPQRYFVPRVHILIDPYTRYLEALQQINGDDPRYIYLSRTWSVISAMPDNSIDSIFAIDMIEHTTKADGQYFLRCIERIARKQVVIFTPLGFYPQTVDKWNMGGDYWQTHRSGWGIDDFDDSWQLLCCEDYHGDCGALWAFKDMAR